MAEIDGGGLHFESTLDNDKLDRAIAETIRRIQGLSDGFVDAGESMDEATAEIVESIEVQKKVIEELEAAVESLERTINEVEPGDAQQVVVEQAAKAKEELQAEREALEYLNNEFEKMSDITIPTGDIVGAGNAVVSTTENIIESLSRQRQVVAALEKDLESLYRYQKTAPNDAQFYITEQIDKTKAAISSARQKLESLDSQLIKRFKTGFGATADSINKAFDQITAAIMENENAIIDLENEYNNLGKQIGRAFESRRDDDVRALTAQQNALKGEIKVRQQVLKELQGQSNALEDQAAKIEADRKKIEENAKAQNTLRVQIRNVRDEMAALRNEAEKNGVTLDENTGRYAELRDELGRLYTIQTDMQKQATILSNTQEKQFQGIISGLSGLAGGFSAATGTISLFAGKNDDLQKVMTRVQSVMAISIGLQQVSQTLYKDSAFQLTTVAKAKKLLTAATNGLSTALGISNVAAKALMATLTLGLSLAITGIIVLTEKYISKVKAAKKEQEEFFKAVSEGVYKPIGAIQMLSERWNQLGDNLEEKRKFIQDNKKDFEDLGWAVKGVEDAERILSSPEHLQRFIDAQMAKARAMIYTEQAYENLKKQIELQQKLDETPEFTTVRTGGGAVGSYDTPAKNWRYKQIEDELSELSATITKGYADAIEQEKLGAKILEELGVESAEAYAKGSIGALQNAIKEKNNLLVKATSEPERATLRKEIDAMQKEVERMTGKGGETKRAGKDQFLQMLDDRKKAYSDYEKWLNSTDATIRNEAREHFAELLKDGESYIEYLYGMRSKAMESGDQVQIKALNSMIAAEMQKGDDKEEKKQQEHVKKLIEDYGLYYDERVRLHEEYLNDIEALNKQLETETDPEKKKVIETAKENRTKTYDKDLKAARSGDPEYDAMLKEYATFEQKKQAIIDDYTEKRRLAEQKGNKELVEQLNKDEEKALQGLVFDKIMNSDAFMQLFSNLDRLSVNKMIELRNKIESEWEDLNLSPEQWKALRERIDEVTQAIEERNPFKALLDAITRYKRGEKGVDFKDIARSASASIDLVKGSFDAVVDGFAELGVTGDEVTQKLLGDISNLMDSTSQLAKGVAQSNPLGIIQGSIGVLTSVFNVFNFRDRRAERQIRKHAENVRNLERAYNSLEKAIDSALGSGRYNATQDAIKNLEQQQKELARQAELERGKKKSDKNKVREYEDAVISAKDRQKELVEQLREDIMGLDVRSAAEQLGNAFIDAFKSGEDAVEAFGKKADDIVANIMQKMLIQKVLEEPLGRIMDRYAKRWYNDKGDFIGFDSVMRDANQMGVEIKGLGDDFAAAMASLPDDIKKYFVRDDTDNDASLSGAIKGVSEETASKLGGQINAIRMNQAEATAILRNQLIQLSVIAQNTSYNRYLKSIDERMARIESKPDTLRAQGLGF